MKKISLLIAILLFIATAPALSQVHRIGNLPYADMHIHENAVATAMNTVDVPHLIQGIFADEDSDRFTFSAGSTGAITAFANAGDGKVTATSAGHTLTDGAILSISGTTNYNGVFAVSGVAGNDFNFTDTWVADDATGNFYEGDNYVADAGTYGKFKAEFHVNGVTAGTNKDYTFELFVNTTFQTNAESTRRFAVAGDIGSIGGGGIITIAAGDIITFGIIPLTTATNFTVNHGNVVFHGL